MPAPQNHAARRAIVERHLPRLLDRYGGPCGLSVTTKHHNEHAMTKDAGRKAARSYEILTKSISRGQNHPADANQGNLPKAPRRAHLGLGLRPRLHNAGAAAPRRSA